MSRAGLRLDPRLGAAVIGAKAAGVLSRVLGFGGTALPGRVAGGVDPQALEKLAARLDCRVLVAGTNGKTTTSRILADVLVASGYRVVHNRAGANLVSGIVSALASQPSPGTGRTPTVAVLETDEAALPEVLARTSPTLVLLTNLFRDQLDRYGEVDHVLARWRSALERLPADSTLVVNGDDPSLVALTDGLAASCTLFGIDDAVYTLPAVPHAAEAITCWRCGRQLAYSAIYVGHLGQWHCPGCHNTRPVLDVAGEAVELWSYDFQSLKVRSADDVTRIEAGLPGLYNTYNAIAAVTAAHCLGVPMDVTQRSVARYRGAFGRAERLEHGGRSLLVMLVKNPVGCNEVLRTLTGVDRPLTAPMLLCLNDAASDGRDVSWIWDVDFETLAGTTNDFFCAGSRWADMRNRLYYAGIASERIHGLGADLGTALDEFVAALPEGGSGFVLPTYSAMLDIRGALAKRQRMPAFWSE